MTRVRPAAAQPFPTPQKSARLSCRAPSSQMCESSRFSGSQRRFHDLPVRYVGFTVPDELFVGYGFDIDERFRNLPDIYLTTGKPADHSAHR